MRILAIGDVVGKIGVNFLKLKLPKIREDYNIDFVIVNGENSSDGNGILPISANNIFSAGADVITGGNHTFKRKEIFRILNENNRIVRPANYPAPETPGAGVRKFLVKNTLICVINLLGVLYMECMKPPIDTMDEVLKNCQDCKIKIVDFHAEATAEKLALAYYLDGRVSAIFGTHTHVQTSDECVLPNGTGYITDVGMTGPVVSVLGVKKELSIKRMKNRIPVRFENAEGPCKIECVIFDVDESSGLTRLAKRLRIF